MSTPLVTVVVAAYCAETFLVRAINSLISQSYENWEAIIVDDCSSDGTYRVARNIAASDPRIKVIRLAENGGPSVARNAGIRASSGDWIAVLDADDKFDCKRLENLVALSAVGDYGIIFDNMSDLCISDQAGAPYWPIWCKKGSEIQLSEMLKGCAGAFSMHYGILKPFISREALNSTGVLYDETLRRGEDVNLALRLMLNGVRAGRVRDIGYFYDRPPANSTTNASGNNLKDSYIGTLKVKNEFWDTMTFEDKVWLSVRLANTYVCDEWPSFLAALRGFDGFQVLRLLFRSGSVRYKLLVGLGPSRIFRYLFGR